jgi:hypothetical protein
MNLSSPANLLIAGIYWVIVGIMALFSLFGVYVLLRYGANQIFSLVLSIIYGFFFLTLLFQSYQLLTALLV